MNQTLRVLCAIAIAVPLCLSVDAAAQKRKKKPAEDAAAQNPSMEFAPEEVTKATGPPSKVFERALKLYEGEDFYNASIEMHKVIEGESGDSDQSKQRAEFWMGKILYNLGYYSAALVYFGKIVDKGASHQYYNATLKWLASLSRKLPETAGILEKIGKYQRSELDQPALEAVKWELYYLLGRFFYTQGQFPQAVELFEAVPDESEFFARAQFFAGVTYVRAAGGGAPGPEKEKAWNAAVKSFGAIIKKHQAKPDAGTKEFIDVAALAMGRVFYSVADFVQGRESQKAMKDFSKAIKYYDLVPQESPDWLAALFESSWAHFRLGAIGHSKALGNIHTLNAPFFENEFFPESHVLKAVIYFYNCLYDRSEDSIKEFKELYEPLKRDLDELLGKHTDPADFFEYMAKIRTGQAGLPERVERLAKGQLQDRTLRKHIAYVEELDRELRQVEKAEPAWKSTAVAGKILEDLTLRKSLAINEAGKLARMRIERLSKDIGDLIRQAEKISIQTDYGRKGELEEAIKKEQEESKKVQVKVIQDLQIDDEHQFYPFTGEYWKDELGYYRFKILNRCGTR
jgi:tetratricopeptide (TPR) repeat protein